MIDKALDFIVTELNEYLNVMISETPVILTMLREGASGESTLGNDKVACSLVNLEEDRIAMKQLPYAPPVNGISSRVNPEIYLNVYLVFAVNPDDGNYKDAIRLLSHVITFFQGKNEFNTTNSPGLDPELNSVSMNLYSLPIEQQNYLWSGLGTKYLPSVLYKMRLVKIKDGRVLDSGPGITSIDTTAVTNQ